MRNSITARNCLFLCVAIAGTAMFFIGCKDLDPVNPAATPTARIMTVFTSPSPTSPDTVDVLIDNIVYGTGLRYPTNLAITYTPVPAGTHELRIRGARSASTLAIATFQVIAGTSASLFIVDSLSRASLLTTVDSLATPVAGKAKIRFAHLSPNAPTYDLAIAGRGVISGLDNRAFKQVSNFALVDTGRGLTLQLLQAGTSARDTVRTAFQLASGRIYTVFARGFKGATTNRSLQIEVVTNN
jgi:hypothetical protein